MAEFPDHKIFVIRDMTYADCSGIRAVDLESIALVGPDRNGCFEQDLKMYLLDACLGMVKKLLDESISDSFTLAIFPHVNREDVTPGLRPMSWRHVEARDSDQISPPEGTKDRSAEPVPIGSQHRLSALVLFSRTKRLRVRPKRLRANVAKDLQVVDSQSSDVRVHLGSGRMWRHDRRPSSASARIYRHLHHTTAPRLRRAISQRIDSPFRREVVDLAAR